EALGKGAVLIDEELDRHLAAEAGVARQEHLAHATAAQLADQLVLLDPPARLKTGGGAAVRLRLAVQRLRRLDGADVGISHDLIVAGHLQLRRWYNRRVPWVSATRMRRLIGLLGEAGEIQGD